tara:strand:+ start:140 stop:1396 length:1257 start_codon:yes stop_codon:yes gene_type:complete
MKDCTEFPNLIVINPFGRGGSVFFQSLLDGHPNIATLPSFGAFYSKIPKKISTNEKFFLNELDKFIHDNYNIFDTSKGYFGKGKGYTSGLFGKNSDEHIITNTDIFKKKIIEIKNKYFDKTEFISRRFFFSLIHLSFHEIYYGSYDKIRYLSYHPHNFFELRYLIKDFPNLYFVGMTRNPLSDWNSWKKVLSIRLNTKIQKINILHTFNNSYFYSRDVYLFSLIKNKIKNKKIIDLIYLHQQNINLIKNICNWLKIDFHKNLIKSTFCNKEWAGNYADRSIKSSFDPERKDSTSQLSIFEKDFIIKNTQIASSFLNYKDLSKNFSYLTKIKFCFFNQLINFYKTKNSISFLINKDLNNPINRKSFFVFVKVIRIIFFKIPINFISFMIENSSRKKMKKLKYFNKIMNKNRLDTNSFFT